MPHSVLELVEPRLSVVLCTYNRSHMLPTAIDSLLNQSLAKSEYEIVVVDNASTDDTCAVIKVFQTQHSCPAIILVPEPIQGLGYARNTGCKNARGRYVAFMDDDCIAPEKWLQSILESFEEVKPEPWSVGGPIFPIYCSPKPNWFKDEYERWTWGEQARFLQRGESFFGDNMAFKRSLVEQYGGFDLRVGMSGIYISGGEETALFERMWHAAGESCLFYYCPEASMFHRIFPQKLTISYRLKRAFAEGQASHCLHAPHSLGERLNGLARAIAAWLWHVGRALIRTRPAPFWENWVVETGGVLAFQTGRVACGLGLLVPVKGAREK